MQPAQFHIYDFSKDKPSFVAQTIGGLMSPIVSVFASLLVYLAFRAQIRANEVQSAALKLQVKANELQTEALKMTQAQADSTIILNQIAQLQSIKESVLENCQVINYYIHGSSKYRTEELEPAFIGIENYINELNLSCAFIENSLAYRDLFWKKLCFLHAQINVQLVEISECIEKECDDFQEETKKILFSRVGTLKVVVNYFAANGVDRYEEKVG